MASFWDTIFFICMQVQLNEHYSNDTWLLLQDCCVRNTVTAPGIMLCFHLNEVLEKTEVSSYSLYIVEPVDSILRDNMESLRISKTVNLHIMQRSSLSVFMTGKTPSGVKRHHKSTKWQCCAKWPKRFSFFLFFFFFFLMHDHITSLKSHKMLKPHTQQQWLCLGCCRGLWLLWIGLC